MPNLLLSHLFCFVQITEPFGVVPDPFAQTNYHNLQNPLDTIKEFCKYVPELEFDDLYN